MQQTTHMIGMIGYPKRLGNHLRYTLTGPQRTIKAGCLGALQQEFFQLLFVLGTQLTAPTRMRFGFEPSHACLCFHRLPTRYRGRSGLNQTSHFVDALAGVKQLSRPLTTIFQPLGTTFRSHINEYKLFL